jgi:hypothetical protein
MNTSVDGYSEAVIYDNTSPLVGKMEVKSTGMKGFVTSHQLSLEWSDIEDMESGKNYNPTKQEIIDVLVHSLFEYKIIRFSCELFRLLQAIWYTL